MRVQHRGADVSEFEFVVMCPNCGDEHTSRSLRDIAALKRDVAELYAYCKYWMPGVHTTEARLSILVFEKLMAKHGIGTEQEA